MNSLWQSESIVRRENEELKKLQLSSGLKNIAKVSTGTILGQIISILVLPIYTRIYGASIIGDWTLFTSISVIVGTFSDLGLMNAIMIEKEEKSVELYQVVTTIVLFFSVRSEEREGKHCCGRVLLFISA